LRAHAIIDYKELKEYLEKRKKVAATKPLASALPQQPAISPRPLRRERLTKKAITLSPAWALSQQNLDALHFFVQQLQLKAYSPSTIRTYRNEFLQLLQLLKHKPVNELTTDELKRYMVYAMKTLGISENTAHSRLNAIYPVGFIKIDYVLLCLRFIERKRPPVLYRLYIQLKRKNGLS